MPITQQPTLNNIAPEANQFEIVFGINMASAENRIGVTVPNLGPFIADTYTVDFLNIVSPARGNIPAVRCLQFTLRTVMAQPAGVPPQIGNIYIFNPQTNQVIALCPPTPGPGFASVVMGNVPFFVKANQPILVYRDATAIQNTFCYLSVSCFTYDCSSFLATMVPAPTLFDVGPAGAAKVQLVAPNPLPVSITGQPISVTVTNPSPFQAEAFRVATGVDLNTFTAGGIFVGVGPLNSPAAAQDFTWMVIPTDVVNYCTQMAWQVSAGATSITWVRQLKGGVWTPWEKLTETP